MLSRKHIEQGDVAVVVEDDDAVDEEVHAVVVDDDDAGTAAYASTLASGIVACILNHTSGSPAPS